MIRIKGRYFKDEHGRTRLLRGVNLGGSSKIPTRPDGATYQRASFFEHRTVSFVGRPFPLVEADEHFRRLRRWGLTCLRFLVTWEAIEHAGPGQHDEEYLDYLRAIVVKAGAHGLTLFIDPHQDVWSRWSGGDGAPGWTLEAVGLDLTRLHPTGAAIVHALHGDPFPRMVWPSNYSKLAAATMFTLFFAGNDFAPQTRINGEPVQDYLQQHFCRSMQLVAERLAGLEHVLGYDTLNEPSPGYIGWQDLARPGGIVLLDACPSPYQAMLLGEGRPQDVGVWEIGLTGMRRTGQRRLNPDGQRAWQTGHGCVWRQHGVWDLSAAGEPHLLRPDYFAAVKGHTVSLARDYFPPFVAKYAAAIRAVDSHAMIFTESAPETWPPDDMNRVYAPHWYDAWVLMTKTYSPLVAIDRRSRRPVWLPGNIRRSFADQLADFNRAAAQVPGGAPVLLGEFGIPFDLHAKAAYRSGDFRSQTAALDRTFQALETNLQHGTLWNYTADNTNARGDLWNDEDLSVFSHDQMDKSQNPDTGGRALRALVRPYPVATAGQPLRLSFDMQGRMFEYTFQHDPQCTQPTEIFVPQYQYPRGCQVEISDGCYELHAVEQRLLYWHARERPDHTLRIKPAN